MKCSEEGAKIIEENNESLSPSQSTPTTKENSNKEEKKQNIVTMAVKLNNFEKGTKLGEGSFGKVYKLTDKENNQVYCAKISKKVIEDNSLEDLLSLVTEVSLFSKFDHPAIVKFIGYSTINFKNDPKPVIIMEYTPNGSLKDALKLESLSRSLSEWDDTHKLINIYGIASAMAYLHLHDILHRDLKTDNILLDSYLFPKVADFGLSTIDQNSTEKMIFGQSNLTCGTPLYMSPEILKERKYTKAGDVYAFALIVYEIVTNKTPFEELHSFLEIIKKVAIEGERPQIDNKDIPQSYKDLMMKCWQEEPEKRPTFNEIVDIFEKDEGFITSSIDKDDYLNYIDYVKTYQSKFDSSKPQIPIRFKVSNSKDSRLTSDLMKFGLNNEKDLYGFVGRRNFGFSMTGGINKSFIDLKKSADAGNYGCIIKCGDILYNGNSEVKPDKKLASVYIKKAADLGHHDSMLKYAEMCYKGDGIPINFDEAFHYFKIAAEKDNNHDSKGMYRYAQVLLDRRCSGFNPSEGLEWLERAAFQNIPRADFKYSNKAALKAADILYNGKFGLPVDKARASKLYEVAADGNSDVAQCNLGLMLMNGDGIPMNKEKALFYFRFAANNNNLIGIENYLKLLSEGVKEEGSENENENEEVYENEGENEEDSLY